MIMSFPEPEKCPKEISWVKSVIVLFINNSFTNVSSIIAQYEELRSWLTLCVLQLQNG